MGLQHRGRPRKFRWYEASELHTSKSSEAQLLKLASVNNALIAELSVSGCPQCGSSSFRLRYDRKHDNIRFYCPECKHETSFHIKKPPRDQLQTVPIYSKQGILTNEKVVDRYHEQTKREKTDAIVQRIEQRPDLGGEWFDGTSGTSSQSRYMTREEALERIAVRRMKAQIRAMLTEIEDEQKDDRLASFRADVKAD